MTFRIRQARIGIPFHDRSCIPMPAKPPSLTPRKIPRQQRSIKLVEALRETCLHILRNEGPQAVTAGRLAEESGVAITSIYEYFPTVDAVIGAVLQQVRQQLIDQHHTVPASHAATLFEFLLASVERAVRIRRALTDLHREIYTRHIAEFDVPAPLIETEDDFLNSATSFRASFTRFRAEIRLHNLDEAAFLAVRILQVATRTAVVERAIIDSETALEWRIAWSIYQLLTCTPPSALPSTTLLTTTPPHVY